MNWRALLAVVGIIPTGPHAMDLKGMSPGMDLGTVMEMHPGLRCNPERVLCVLAVPSLEFEPARPKKLEEAGELLTFGGTFPKGWTVDARDFKVGRVSVMLDSGDFGKITTALQAKFGKPKISTTPVQNRMGAKFQNVTMTWTSRDQRLWATKYSAGNLDVMIVSLSSNQFERQQVEEESEEIKLRMKGL